MSSSVLNFIKTNKKQSTPVNMPDKNVFTFGKYKNRTYQEIFDIDKEYVAWVLQADSKYYGKIQKYYTSLIEGNA
jgi:uncharacterized protein (DUF3820 family)